MCDLTDDGADPPLAEQFVSRMAGVWTKYCQDEDELATAMLAHAVNTLLSTMDSPQEVAGLLVGLAVQINPECAGHA